MIFVTVGTHEQPFNRLIQAVDELKSENVIPTEEQVFIQVGYSTYEPQYCEWTKLLPYKDMQQYIQEARIVITHGGPSSFLAPLQYGKIPIVVPRRMEHGEHVNNHQVDFVRNVADYLGNIIVVENKTELAKAIRNYDSLSSELDCVSVHNNEQFCMNLAQIIYELVK